MDTNITCSHLPFVYSHSPFVKDQTEFMCPETIEVIDYLEATKRHELTVEDEDKQIETICPKSINSEKSEIIHSEIMHL